MNRSNMDNLGRVKMTFIFTVLNMASLRTALIPWSAIRSGQETFHGGGGGGAQYGHKTMLGPHSLVDNNPLSLIGVHFMGYYNYRNL